MKSAAQQHLLVFRFSSLGDVAMTVPVIRLLMDQYPQLHVTMVSTEFVRPLFTNIPRVQFYAADLKGKHKGVPGLFKLSRELSKQFPFDGIADLHNVLRTKILKTFFLFSGKPVATIDKGRAEKKELTRQQNKKLRPLKSNFQRYADVFSKLGFPIELKKEGGVSKISIHPAVKELKSQYQLVGIAPIALHREKTYPAEKMQEVIRLLSKENNVKICLFGGKNEAAVLEDWCAGMPNVMSVAGKMSFEEELHWIAGLDVMVSMDSANMHLASLFGVPVVSIWGGTHPYLGFYGWGQDPANAVQIELNCRPSSVFGNKNCHNDLACMKGISPLLVTERIISQLKKRTV